MFIAVEFAQNS